MRDLCRTDNITVRIVEDSGFDGLAIEQDSHSGRTLRTIIGQRHMLPLPRPDWSDRFNRTDSCNPTGDDVKLQSTVLQFDRQSLANRVFALFGNDHAIR